MSVRTPTAFPVDCLNTARSLGNLHFYEQNWQQAIATYQTATTAVELLREWASTDARREEIFASYFKLINQGNFFGSLFFEYEAANPDNSSDLAKKCYLLLLIDNSRAPTIEVLSAGYEWLIILLWYRHKIIYVYQQSRELYQSCRQIYSQLEAEINNFSPIDRHDRKRLKYLNNLLNDLPEKYLEYSRSLPDLQTKLTGLNTNAENYDIAIKKIIDIGGEES